MNEEILGLDGYLIYIYMSLALFGILYFTYYCVYLFTKSNATGRKQMLFSIIAYILLAAFSAYVENFMVFNSLNTIVSIINIVSAIAFISFATGFGKLVKSISNMNVS